MPRKWTGAIQALQIKLVPWRSAYDSPEISLNYLAEISFERSKLFRALAIMLLLDHGSTDLFLHNLTRAGRVRALYLARIRGEAGADQHFTGSAWMHGLLDAIAAADFASVSDIARDSAPFLLPGEDEEDHHYARALYALARHPPDLGAAQRTLDAFHTSLRGADSPRRTVLQALLRHDQGGFDVAFADVQQSFDQAVRVAKERAEPDDFVVSALATVNVEGLAILKLAEHLGFRTKARYRKCPPLARAAMTAPFSETLPIESRAFGMAGKSGLGGGSGSPGPAAGSP